MNNKELSDAIYELGVLLSDPTTGLIVTTMKQDFWEKFKDFELIEAWGCLVDEINRVNTVIKLHDVLVARDWVGDLEDDGSDGQIEKIQQAIRTAYEKKPYPTLEDIQKEIKQ